MAQQAKIDEAALRADIAENQLSNRAIAKKYGVSEKAVRKAIARFGLERDGPRTIGPQPAVRTMPGRSLVPGAMPGAPRSEAPVAITKDEPVTNELIAKRSIDLAARLLDELNASTGHIGELEDEIYAETAADENLSRRNAMLKAVSLPSRSLVLKTIVQAVTGVAEIGQGKVGKADAAKKAASGRFAPPSAPKLAVDNTK